MIDDACAAVDVLALDPDVGAILLLGHSEGTIIAPVVADRRKNVDGMILLCPTVQPMEETLMQQASHFAQMVEDIPGVSGVLTRLCLRFRGDISTVQRRIINKIKKTERKTV